MKPAASTAFPTSQDFADIKARSDALYPVPFDCTCEEFKKKPVTRRWFSVWGRLRGQGSPIMVEGLGVAARCKHEAYFMADFQGSQCPKQVDVSPHGFYEEKV